MSGTDSPDLADFEALNSSSARSRCTVRELIESIPEPDRSTLKAAMDRPSEGPGKIEHAAIERWLRKKGYQPRAGQTIGRHRNGQCACPK